MYRNLYVDCLDTVYIMTMFWQHGGNYSERKYVMLEGLCPW